MDYSPIHNKTELTEDRKSLRNNCTKEEALLWNLLKRKQTGFKFRRQHSVEKYIIDFIAPKKG